LLTKQFGAAPDIFVSLIDTIDPELQSATTDAELGKPGSGIGFLLRELDRRSPLGFDARDACPNKSAVPSGRLEASGNSDREGSAVSTDFSSLNTAKHRA